MDQFSGTVVLSLREGEAPAMSNLVEFSISRNTNGTRSIYGRIGDFRTRRVVEHADNLAKKAATEVVSEVRKGLRYASPKLDVPPGSGERFADWLKSKGVSCATTASEAGFDSVSTYTSESFERARELIELELNRACMEGC